MEERQSLPKMLLGKVVIHLQETETRSMFITLYYYQLKMEAFDVATPEELIQKP
jgi:hypothetical protein